MLGDPREQRGEAAAVIADLHGCDRDLIPVGDLRLVGVPVSVDTYARVDSFCQLGTDLALPWGGSWSAPARMGSPSGTSVTGHANGGQASDQANLMGQRLRRSSTWDCGKKLSQHVSFDLFLGLPAPTWPTRRCLIRSLSAVAGVTPHSASATSDLHPGR
jgi:hypothetical protein